MPTVNPVVEDGISKHNGSTYPPGTIVSGTVNVFNHTFVSIGGLKVKTEFDTMEIPTHLYTPISSHSHSYPCDTFNNNFVTIEGDKIVTKEPLVEMDKYSGDNTWEDNQGTNNFVTIST